MKLLVIALTLCCSVILVRAAPAETQTPIQTQTQTQTQTQVQAQAQAQAHEDKEEKAAKECNATIPVYRNPITVVNLGSVAGIPFNLSHEEQCFLHCYLQKVKFIDESANLRNGTKLLKYVLGKSPELAKYSDVVIAQIYQISKSTLGFHDKCQKSLIMYHEFMKSIFTLLLADGLQSSTGVKDKIVNAIEKNQSVDEDLGREVKQFLGFYDFLVTGIAEEILAEGQSKIIV